MQKSNIYTARMRDKDNRWRGELKQRESERGGNAIAIPGRKRGQQTVAETKANKHTSQMEERTHTNRGYVRRSGCKLFPLFPKFVSALKCQCTQNRNTHSYAA